MADYAANTGLIFKNVSRDYPIPDELKHIKQLVDEHIAKGLSTYNYWWDMNSTEIRNLRHKFLHFSSSYGEAHQPQFINNERRRIIQNG
jgi:hypothetical protein